MADYWSGRGWGAAALAMSISDAGEAVAFDCDTCEDKGVIPNRDKGGTVPCPDCSKAVSPPPPAEPQDAGQDAPAVEWLDWETASQLSSVTTRPVLVFQHGGKPLKFTAETMAELNKLGILCSDTAKRWQPQAKKPIAPAVAYVAHDAALGSQPPFLTDLKTDSESATLKQLKAWINAIETP